MKTKSEQWLDALAWSNKTNGVPSIVSRMIQQHAAKAIRKAKPFKPSIKTPNAVKSLPKLKKELDRVFSIFIRTRDAYNGIAACVTCKIRKRWRKMDAGHYVPRQDLATRWDEDNVYAQCKRCNGFRGGEPEKMAAYIDALAGYPMAEGLRTKSKMKFRPTRDWLEQKIGEYKRKIGEI